MVTTLHWVSPAAREIIVFLSQFHSVSADVLAQRVARRSRHQLARILARDGLPCLKKLRMWVRLIGWMLEWEFYQKSLYRLAIARDMDPAVAYRSVRQLTGLSWRAVRARGLVWLLGELRQSCLRRPIPKNKSGGVVPAALMRQA